MAKKKEEKTNVMRILDQKKIPYTARFYEDGQGPRAPGSMASMWRRALGQDPARGFKTLVARGASKGIYVFEVPAAGEPGSEKGRQSGGGRNPWSCSTWRRSTPSPATSGAGAVPWE